MPFWFLFWKVYLTVLIKCLFRVKYFLMEPILLNYIYILNRKTACFLKARTNNEIFEISNWRWSSVVVKGNFCQNILFVFPALQDIIRRELMSGMSKIYCNSALETNLKSSPISEMELFAKDGVHVRCFTGLLMSSALDQIVNYPKFI